MPIAAAIPALKVAAPFILKGLGKFFGKKGQDKAAKETARAQQATMDAKYKSDFDTFENTENDRLMKTQGIANQLKGARALSPEVVAAALKRRANTAWKGNIADPTKGSTWSLLGDAAGGIGDIAGAMLKERAIADAEQGMSPDYAPGRGGIPTVGTMKQCADGSYSNTGCP